MTKLRDPVNNQLRFMFWMDDWPFEFSKILRLYNKIETTIELSNALKMSCSAIKCCASKVALKYAWGNDCICEEN